MAWSRGSADDRGIKTKNPSTVRSHARVPTFRWSRSKGISAPTETGFNDSDFESSDLSRLRKRLAFPEEPAREEMKSDERLI
jgi:hypothetical protein